jgi:hypothetical protein
MVGAQSYRGHYEVHGKENARPIPFISHDEFMSDFLSDKFRHKRSIENSLSIGFCFSPVENCATVEGFRRSTSSTIFHAVLFDGFFQSLITKPHVLLRISTRRIDFMRHRTMMFSCPSKPHDALLQRPRSRCSLLL